MEYVKNGAKINATTLNDAFRHIDDVTLNGAGKPTYNSKGILGCHNEINFNAQKVVNGGRIEVVNEIASNTNGVKTIEYKVLQVDIQGNVIQGQYFKNGQTFTKTTYSPSIYPESLMKEIGYNAYKNAMDNNLFYPNNARMFEGTYNGLTIKGHYKEVNGEKLISTWWIE